MDAVSETARQRTRRIRRKLQALNFVSMPYPTQGKTTTLEKVARGFGPYLLWMWLAPMAIVITCLWAARHLMEVIIPTTTRVGIVAGDGVPGVLLPAWTILLTFYTLLTVTKPLKQRVQPSRLGYTQAYFTKDDKPIVFFTLTGVLWYGIKHGIFLAIVSLAMTGIFVICYPNVFLR
jgi:hypothetical protein